jgi:hypothetical protein
MKMKTIKCFLTPSSMNSTCIQMYFDFLSCIRNSFLENCVKEKTHVQAFRNNIIGNIYHKDDRLPAYQCPSNGMG